MIVYEATKQSFLEDVYNDQVAKKIKARLGFNVGSSENESWIDTANHMEKILRDNIFPNDISVAMEFKLYNSKLRVDFIICGLNEEKEHTIIVIEFKRWNSAKVVTDRDDMVEVKAYGIVQHPSYQALSYAKIMKNFYAAAEEEKMDIIPCSCLHRYEKTENDAITNNQYRSLLKESPIFLNGENDKLKEFISKHIKYGDNKETLYILEEGGIKPSKQLQDNILNMLNGKEEFSMVDLQKDVFEEAKRLAKLSKKDGKKRVYIVEGGPGTGKSVIAINLLGQFLGKYGMNCQYITKNQTPRDVYSVQLKGTYKKTEIDNLFCGSGSYINEKSNEFDALIVDEAHRLTEKTGFLKRGENQIKEIINATRFAIFFIDSKQRIHIDDYGKKGRIEFFAKELNAEISYGKLNAQFRCGGAEKFIDWVESSLQYADVTDEEIDMTFLKDYRVKVFDNPNELKEQIIRCNNIKNKSRILAGYCWDWISKEDPKGDKYDIEIPEYDFKMKWNFNKTIWAIDKDSVEQAGCIHTSQGLEFDYVGVIIGKDLRYENGKIITDFKERASTDKSLSGIKKMYKENPEGALKLADEIIKNTYRTLLTRGQSGCYIYCEDKALSEYLKNRLTTAKEIIYTVDEENQYTELKVAEDSEEYKYE